jgi:site-specific DNA-methyltransferase (adenine-specific)
MSKKLTSRDPVFYVSLMDAIQWLRRLNTESVDCFFTDPAYESLEEHRAIGTTTRLKDWFPIFRNARYVDLFMELHRVLRNDRHCYVMSDEPTLYHLKPAAEEAGFKWWKAVVWDKETIGNGYHYRTAHEFIVFLEKGKRPLRDRTRVRSTVGPSTVPGTGPIRGKAHYPTEKPVPLIQHFLHQSVEPGMVVADPFMGSGSTLVAAIKEGCDAWGTDIEQRSVDMVVSRMGVEKGAPPSMLMEAELEFETAVPESKPEPEPDEPEPEQIGLLDAPG